MTISSSVPSDCTQPFSLVCSVEINDRRASGAGSTPSPTFEWFFGPNGNTSLPSGLTTLLSSISSSSVASTTYSSSLQFPRPPLRSHAGNYTCRVGGNSKLVANTWISVADGSMSQASTSASCNVVIATTVSIICILLVALISAITTATTAIIYIKKLR